MIQRSIDFDCNYPNTRSQAHRKKEAYQLLSDWKNIVGVVGVNDEIEYIRRFDGLLMQVYEPKWYTNRYINTHYQGRDLTFVGEETFFFGDVADGHGKMFVVAETDEMVMGFQFIHYIARFNEESTGFFRLQMSVAYKQKE